MKIEKFIYLIILIILLTNPVLGTNSSSETNQPTKIDDITCLIDSVACDTDEQYEKVKIASIIVLVVATFAFLKWRKFL